MPILAPYFLQSFCNRHSKLKKKSILGMTQLVKIALILALIKPENSFWAHMKATEMLDPMRCHTLRFNVGHHGHQS
jgi:hypothetical protein